jgi:hypothetical protein
MATPQMLQPRRPQDRLPEPVRPDPATSLTAGLLALTALGLLLGGILAVYDWTVPGAERPLLFGVLAAFVAAMVVQILAATARHLRPGSR